MSGRRRLHHASQEEEKSPLLSHEKISVTPNNGRHVNILKAKVVSNIVLMLAAAAGSSCDPLIAQYIFARLAEEDGFSNNTKVHPCVMNSSDPAVQETNSLQQRTSLQLLYQTLCQCLPAFFACFFVGSYSDFLGRRLILLFSLFTFTIKVSLFVIVIRFSLPFWMLFVAYGIDGLSGSWFSCLIAVYSMSADISENQKDTSFTIYILSTISYFVISATYIGAGFIINEIGYFWAAMLLEVLVVSSFLLALFFFPETICHRQSFRDSSLNPLVHCRRIFGFYFFDGTLKLRLTFSLALSIFFFAVVPDLIISSIDARYQINEPFCWQSTRIGEYSAMRGVTMYGFGIIVLKMLQRCISEEKIATVVILFQSAGYTFEAFIKSSWQFYLVPVILVPSSLCIPIVRSMMAKLAGDSHTGAIFSSVAVLETLCNALSATLVNEVFAATVAQWAGAVYLVLASCGVIAFLLLLLYLKIHRNNTSLEIVVDPPLSIQQASVSSQEII